MYDERKSDIGSWCFSSLVYFGGSWPNTSAMRHPLCTKTALQKMPQHCVHGTVRNTYHPFVNSTIMHNANAYHASWMQGLAEQTYAGRSETYVRLPPLSRLLDLCDLRLCLLRFQRVLTLVLVFIVYRSLMPATQHTLVSVHNIERYDNHKAHRIYVKSIAAHDCSDATLATFTSQLNTVFALPAP